MENIKNFMSENFKDKKYKSIIISGNRDSILKVAKMFDLEDEIIRKQRNYKFPFLYLNIEYEGHNVIFQSNEIFPEDKICIIPGTFYGEKGNEKEENKGTGWGGFHPDYIDISSNISTQE